MKRVTDGMVGVLVRSDFRLEVWKLRPPKQKGVHPDGDYFYLSKIHFVEGLGERSIGLSARDLAALLEIINGVDAVRHLVEGPFDS